MARSERKQSKNNNNANVNNRHKHTDRTTKLLIVILILFLVAEFPLVNICFIPCCQGLLRYLDICIFILHKSCELTWTKECFTLFREFSECSQRSLAQSSSTLATSPSERSSRSSSSSTAPPTSSSTAWCPLSSETQEESSWGSGESRCPGLLDECLPLNSR